MTVGALGVILCVLGMPVSAGAAKHGTAVRLPVLASDCLTHRPTCYTPQALRAAYEIQPLLSRRIEGRGFTVVLPEVAQSAPAQPPVVTDIRSDLADFDGRFGLPPARIRVDTNLAGASASPWLARLEEVQDTELVHTVAPEASIVELLVDPADLTSPARAASAFGAIARTGARLGSVISLSISLGEHFFTPTEVSEISSSLSYVRSRHVTFVASSGDDGVLGKQSTDPPVKEVSLPASDPLVLSVGGTTLDADPATGARIGETAWDTPAQYGANSAASGGGFSHLFVRPSYQAGVPGIGAMRGVPDVAADGSPYSGMAIARSGPGGTYVLTGAGGTSASAPLWAGVIALADQAAHRPLGFVNPAIYRIAHGQRYHKAFHDVTVGDNTMTVAGSSGTVTVTGYEAGPGWDPVTGWGTPDAQVLVPLLAG